MTGQNRLDAERSLHAHIRSVHPIAHAFARPRESTVAVSIADDGEPDLIALVHALWKHGARVAVPVLRDDPRDFSMSFHEWQPADELHQGRFGIPVPPERPPVQPTQVLVPLVGFDPAGNRIGRGAGFYDRFLATTGAATVGVAFECQRVASLPAKSHDMPLPVVVTELGVRFTEKHRQYRGHAGSVGKDGDSCE